MCKFIYKKTYFFSSLHFSTPNQTQMRELKSFLSSYFSINSSFSIPHISTPSTKRTLCFILQFSHKRRILVWFPLSSLSKGGKKIENSGEKNNCNQGLKYLLFLLLLVLLIASSLLLFIYFLFFLMLSWAWLTWLTCWLLLSCSFCFHFLFCVPRCGLFFFFLTWFFWHDF